MRDYEFKKDLMENKKIDLNHMNYHIHQSLKATANLG